jgi:iron-sulfur cluster repair protein YtfE (RIC family)
MRGDQLDSAPAAAPQAHLVDTRDMIEVHRVIRREFGLTPALVRATAAGDLARATTVAGHLGLMSQLLAIHHGEEDRQLWPKLAGRVPDQIGPVVALMEHQHEQIHRASESAAALLPTWRVTAAAAAGARLAEVLDGLCTILDEHLAAEEQQILPLAARHLTEKEWARLGAEGFAQVPKNKLPLVVGMLMYQGDPEVIGSMLAHAPAPARLVLPVLGPRAYARYARRVHLTATP